MIEPQIFMKLPISFQGICLIYPPSIREVLQNERFGQYVKLLTTTEDDLKEELFKNSDKKISPFDFLLINCYHSAEFLQVVRDAFRFFIHQEIEIIYETKQIHIGKYSEAVLAIDNVDQLKFLNEENFFDFQNAIRCALGETKIAPPETPNPNEDPRIAAIKEKARRRDRIKAKQKNKGGISLTTTLVAICCMGIGITPLNIGEMSYAAIGPIIKMMQEKEKYDIDIRSLLAGADSKKIKPKYWIRNSEKE